MIVHYEKLERLRAEIDTHIRELEREMAAVPLQGLATAEAILRGAAAGFMRSTVILVAAVGLNTYILSSVGRGTLGEMAGGLAIAIGGGAVIFWLWGLSWLLRTRRLLESVERARTSSVYNLSRATEIVVRLKARRAMLGADDEGHR